MSRRLSATLDGKPVYLYEFVQGRYEDRRQLLYAHVEELSRAEIIARFRTVLATLPAKIKDYYTGREPDLVERALELAGFVAVHDAIPLGLALHGVGTPSLDRESLERSLNRFALEALGAREQKG